MPAVSVIIPVYNPGQFFEKCLDSVCGQTLTDIEIICVDDGSTDGSLEALKKRAMRDPRIVIMESRGNKGAACARNAAMEIMKGEFVAFVDSDDFIDPTFLEVLYKKAKFTGADIVKGNRKMYDPKTGLTSHHGDYFHYINEKIKVNKAYFYNAFTTAIYNSSLIREHNIRFMEGLTMFEDAPFCILASIFNKKTELDMSVSYYYTVNPASVCHKGISTESIQNRLDGTKAILDFLEKAPVSEEHKAIVQGYLFEEMDVLCRNASLTDEMIRMATKGYYMVLQRCISPKTLLENRFIALKAQTKETVLSILRKQIKSKTNSN